MGSASRTDRCQRFIQEFGADYVRRFGVGAGRRLVVVAEQLVFDDRDEVVRFEMTVRPEGTEEDMRFMLEPVFFAPEQGADDQVTRVTDDLELDADSVRRRFKVAGLTGRRR